MNNDGSKQVEPIILLIDGHCNLCHAITRFVIKRDSAKRFRFASIQSKLGQRLLLQGGLATDDLDTFVMVQGNMFYTKSDASLRVFRELKGLWPLLYGCSVVPLFLRNLVYDWIANRRYRWFGRTEVCLLPTAELRSRIIDDIDEVTASEKEADLRRDRY
ncbi:thiol-disulfide oxidoreductase DCC family protein [Paenibacillus yanchengensis]|uniref:Thiol-disulfide oxidoreductase DCC family protein n=1 Tax=Paenibacillus yanchengensis TaxID=2035833 RepID=A0ABW4YIU4_9BACL